MPRFFRAFPPLGAFLFALLVLIVLLLSAATPARAATAGVVLDLKVSADGQYLGAAGLTQASAPLDVDKLLQLTAGTGSGKADKAYIGERTLAASGTESLDLAGGLTDPVGGTLTFAKVKAILVIADAANTNSVVVGGAGSNTFVGPFADATDKVTIPPGGSLLLTHPGAGWTVTASTGDILLVANSSSGTGVTYRLLIVGTSS